MSKEHFNVEDEVEDEDVTDIAQMFDVGNEQTWLVCLDNRHIDTLLDLRQFLNKRNMHIVKNESFVMSSASKGGGLGMNGTRRKRIYASHMPKEKQPNEIQTVADHSIENPAYRDSRKIYVNSSTFTKRGNSKSNRSYSIASPEKNMIETALDVQVPNTSVRTETPNQNSVEESENTHDNKLPPQINHHTFSNSQCNLFEDRSLLENFEIPLKCDGDCSYVIDTNSSYVIDRNSSYVIDTKSSNVIDRNSSYVIDTKSSNVVNTNSSYVVDTNSYDVDTNSYDVDTNSSYTVDKKSSFVISEELNTTFVKEKSVIADIEKDTTNTSSEQETTEIEPNNSPTFHSILTKGKESPNKSFETETINEEKHSPTFQPNLVSTPIRTTTLSLLPASPNKKVLAPKIIENKVASLEKLQISSNTSMRKVYSEESLARRILPPKVFYHGSTSNLNSNGNIRNLGNSNESLQGSTSSLPRASSNIPTQRTFGSRIRPPTKIPKTLSKIPTPAFVSKKTSKDRDL